MWILLSRSGVLTKDLGGGYDSPSKPWGLFSKVPVDVGGPLILKRANWRKETILDFRSGGEVGLAGWWPTLPEDLP